MHIEWDFKLSFIWNTWRSQSEEAEAEDIDNQGIEIEVENEIAAW